MEEVNATVPNNDPELPNTNDASNEVFNPDSTEPKLTLQQMNETSQPEQTLEMSNTDVKELLDCGDDISVATDSIPNVAMDVQVKEPVATNLSTNSSEIDVDYDEIKEKLKLEIRDIVREEMAAVQQELKPDVVPNKSGAVPKQPTAKRTPKKIKQEIKELRKEMKEIKLQKKRETVVAKLQKPHPITRRFAASFICENLSDGSCVAIAETFVKYWVFKNEGIRTWDDKVTLEFLQESPSLGSSVDPAVTISNTRKWGPQQTSVPVPIVNTSGTAVLAVTHVAPTYPCTYTTSWCLHRKGRTFGPKVWCTVQVVEKEDMASLNQPCLFSETEPESETSFIMNDAKWIAQKSSEQTTELKIQLDNDRFKNIMSFDMEDISESDIMKAPNEKYSYNQPTNQRSSLDETPQVKLENESEAILQDKAENHQDEQENQPLEESERDESYHDVSEFESITSIDQNEDQEEDANGGDVEELNEESSSSDEDDEHMSDFEVIPLPECFNTSRPLSAPHSLEGDEEQNAAQASVDTKEHSVKAKSLTDHDNEEVNQENKDVSHENQEVNNKPNHENDDEENDEADHENDESDHENKEADHENADHENEEVNRENGEVIPVTDTTIQEFNDIIENQNRSESIANGESSAQSVLPDNSSEITNRVLPIPQSVLDLDKPCPVVDYSEGYVTPRQRVAPVDEPWTQPPIPLPRGVLDANEPWNPLNNSAIASTTPPPTYSTIAPTTPPTRSAISPTSAQTPKPWDAESVLSSEAEANAVVAHQDDDFMTGEDPPQIYYPPDEDEDEFILAPQNATTAPQTTPRHVFNPSPMEQLFEMGFEDYNRNIEVLNRCGGDVTKAVQALLFGDTRRRPARNGFTAV